MYARPLRRVRAAATWRHARIQYASMAAERDALRTECANLKREREQLCDLLRLAHALVRSAKSNVGAELTALERQREIQRAEAATRDDDTPLQ
jgi:hypothetical protein